MPPLLVVCRFREKAWHSGFPAEVVEGMTETADENQHGDAMQMLEDITDLTSDDEPPTLSTGGPRRNWNDRYTRAVATESPHGFAATHLSNCSGLGVYVCTRRMPRNLDEHEGLAVSQMPPCEALQVPTGPEVSDGVSAEAVVNFEGPERTQFCQEPWDGSQIDPSQNLVEELLSSPTECYSIGAPAHCGFCFQ